MSVVEVVIPLRGKRNRYRPRKVLTPRRAIQAGRRQERKRRIQAELVAASVGFVLSGPDLVCGKHGERFVNVNNNASKPDPVWACPVCVGLIRDKVRAEFRRHRRAKGEIGLFDGLPAPAGIEFYRNGERNKPERVKADVEIRAGTPSELRQADARMTRAMEIADKIKKEWEPSVDPIERFFSRHFASDKIEDIRVASAHITDGVHKDALRFMRKIVGMSPKKLASLWEGVLVGLKEHDGGKLERKSIGGIRITAPALAALKRQVRTNGGNPFRGISKMERRKRHSLKRALTALVKRGFLTPGWHPTPVGRYAAEHARVR